MRKTRSWLGLKILGGSGRVWILRHGILHLKCQKQIIISWLGALFVWLAVWLFACVCFFLFPYLSINKFSIHIPIRSTYLEKSSGRLPAWELNRQIRSYPASNLTRLVTLMYSDFTFVAFSRESWNRDSSLSKFFFYVFFIIVGSVSTDIDIFIILMIWTKVLS